MARQHPTTIVHNQPSWNIATNTAEAFLTEVGGHVGPVTFTLAGKKISPLSVAPWNDEPEDKTLPAIIRVLRGDFFCMPFGGNSTPFRGEKYPVHGETANNSWELETYSRHDGTATLHCSLDTKSSPGRKGRADKFIILRNNETVLYQKHIISGMAGPMNFGHHAMVRFQEEGLISTSRAKLRQVWLEPTERPEARGYSSLKPGAIFNDLAKVPTVFDTTTDLSRFPARQGFEDIVINVNDPRDNLGWTAVVFPKQRYVFFSLKHPRTLAATLFWISNGGRHYAPWNGRHLNVIGIEEITSFFHAGLAESAKLNPLSKRGIPTVVKLNPRKPLVVNYILGIAPIPAGFDHVKELTAHDGQIELRSRNGKKTKTACDTTFLTSGI